MVAGLTGQAFDAIPAGDQLQGVSAREPTIWEAGLERSRGSPRARAIGAASFDTFVLGLGSSVAEAKAPWGCAPGYPVCWFSAECIAGRCVRCDCASSTCDDPWDRADDCIRCEDFKLE